MPILQRSGLAFASTCIHPEQVSAIPSLARGRDELRGWEGVPCSAWRHSSTLPTDVSDEEWAVLAPSLTQQVGDLTFEIIRRDATDILTASDEELVDAMRFFGGFMKMIVEPTGTLGFAGFQTIADQFRGKRIGIIVSGGNVDLGRYAGLIG